MSELKEYKVRIGRKLYQTLPPIVYVVADDNQPKLLNDKVYLKSEADKMIAELKDKANYNECEYKLKSEELADTCRFYEDELRHQKYKRCLAMTNYWGLVSACTRREIQLKCMRRELKWRKLAEKFKEAK